MVMRGVTPCPRSGVAGGRNYSMPPTPAARGGGWEEQPHAQGQGQWREDQTHVQGAVAVKVQEGLEELSDVEGQEGQQ